MSNVQWVLKRKNHDGGESIITRYSLEADAQDDADFFNDMYQSSQYYVEPFDSVNAAEFFTSSELW